MSYLTTSSVVGVDSKIFMMPEIVPVITLAGGGKNSEIALAISATPLVICHGNGLKKIL